MSAPPAVSVVLPAHNRVGSIGAAIESVLAQSFDDFELIVVDDGSTDGTEDAARAVDDPRLTVIALGTNRGVSAARNAGIDAARAPWIAFQDSDDEWLPAKLALQMARLGQSDAIAAYCGMAILRQTKGGRTALDYVPGPAQTLTEGAIHDTLAKGSFISTQTLIARADLIREEGGFDPNLPALVDWDLALRLSRRGDFAFVDAPLVFQRFSENSITKSAKYRVEARERILEKHRDAFGAVPGAVALNARAVAGGWRRLGERARARDALRTGLTAAPFNPYLRLMDLALALRR